MLDGVASTVLPSNSHTLAWVGVGACMSLHVSTRGCTELPNGRYPVVMGMVLNAPLLTTGAKTGKPRLVHVVYFHDGTDPIAVASYGGEPENPQW